MADLDSIEQSGPRIEWMLPVQVNMRVITRPVVGVVRTLVHPSGPEPKE